MPTSDLFTVMLKILQVITEKLIWPDLELILIINLICLDQL